MNYQDILYPKSAMVLLSRRKTQANESAKANSPPVAAEKTKITTSGTIAERGGAIFTLHRPDYTSERIRVSLRTKNIEEARVRRDELFHALS